MLYVTVLLCWAVSASAAPPVEVLPLEKQQPTVIPIVSQSEELEPNGTYKFSYETGNGIKREETSYSKLVPRAQGRSADSTEGGEADSDEIHVQVGSYSYTAPDGSVISVRYIADENGFQPIGDHIPRVGGPAPSVSSAEKTGRALAVADNAEASSSPAAKLAPKFESRIAAAPEESKIESNATEVPSKVPESGTSENDSVTTEAIKTAKLQESSTTGVASSAEAGSAGSTEAALSEQSTTVAGNTESTTVGVKTESPNTDSSVAAKLESSTADAGKLEASTTELLQKDATTTESAKEASTDAKTEASTTIEAASTTVSSV